MTLQNKLKDDLKTAIKAQDATKKEALRVILGELARSDKKNFSDGEVINILKKLIKSERELMDKSGQRETSSFIGVIETYLPEMVTEDQIRQWIADNIDFSVYKNKMQAMGTIMAHFGPAADGNTVKRVLQKFLVPS